MSINQNSEIQPRAHIAEIPVWCTHDAIVPVKDITPNPLNPNTHPEKQIELLGKVIKANGWREPITVSKRSGMIVKGHGRLEAAIQIGAIEVPVEYQDYLTEADEYADMVADNQIQEFSAMNDEALNDLLDTVLSDYSLEALGILDIVPEEEYQPILNPKIGGGDVTEDDIAKAGGTLDSLTSNIRQQIGVICPECGADFTIDKP